MFKEAVRIDELRQATAPRNKHGLVGKTLGCIIILSYFTLLPSLLKITWPWLLTFPLTSMYVGSIFCMNIGIFLLYNCSTILLYLCQFTFFNQFKNTPKAWPWHKSNWNSLLAKSLLYIAINFLVVTPVMVWVSLRTSLPFDFGLQAWPSCLELAWQFLFFLVVEDTLFYWSHRLLHTPRLYWIHKHHHQYTQTIGLTSQFVHPLEYVLSGTIPSTMGFQLLVLFCRVHYSTILIWVFYRLVQSYESHSGYTWSWNTLALIPFSVGSDHHDFHHAMNTGNYGSVFLFWDGYCGTQKQFVCYLEKKASVVSMETKNNTVPMETNTSGVSKERGKHS